MCFDAPLHQYGLFVATTTHHNKEEDTNQRETIVGFCCVDGHPNDSSSKVEYLTESTLAFTCPRPYLSDLGVLPSHRRKGIGQTLVAACEEWAISRGWDKMYLKVDERNEGTEKLYEGMGYRRTVLPGVRVGSGAKKWGHDVLLEKGIGAISNEEAGKEKKKWFRDIWRRKTSVVT